MVYTHLDTHCAYSSNTMEHSSTLQAKFSSEIQNSDDIFKSCGCFCHKMQCVTTMRNINWSLDVPVISLLSSAHFFKYRFYIFPLVPSPRRRFWEELHMKQSRAGESLYLDLDISEKPGGQLPWHCVISLNIRFSGPRIVDFDHRRCAKELIARA